MQVLPATLPALPSTHTLFISGRRPSRLQARTSPSESLVCELAYVHAIMLVVDRLQVGIGSRGHCVHTGLSCSAAAFTRCAAALFTHPLHSSGSPPLSPPPPNARHCTSPRWPRSTNSGSGGGLGIAAVAAAAPACGSGGDCAAAQQRNRAGRSCAARLPRCQRLSDVSRYGLSVAGGLAGAP